MMNGTLKASGVTFYFRNGQMIMRSAHSNEKRSNTRGQFIARQRMKHSIALWQRLKPLNPMFIGGKSTYTAFTSLANRLPVVFCPDSSSLLMPGIPVSSGPMPSMEQRLDIIEGTPALVTDLKRSDLQRGDHLMLYTAQQTAQGRKPVVTFSVRKMATADFITVDGCLALKGSEFGDTDKGWALVLVNGDRCSTQCIVTRNNAYERYTTEEALAAAAEKYGGLTD